MNPLVETTNGKVEGIEKDGLKIFLGIPFAAPPTGERRWLPPQPVEPWTGIKETKSYVATAPQNIVPISPDSPFQPSPKLDLSLGVQPAINEDCFQLNVWTPGIDNARRPVMVWIHGGGFTSGTGASPASNGGTLASRGDIVLVTINYRLNVFGFLRLKDITNGRIPSTGNEGMLDQVAALQWVRDNIEKFGGDPGNVTIFGISAGGASVAALLAMKEARGLFHKAISQSGSAHFLTDLDEANNYAEYFIHVLGDGGSASSLQTLTMEQVLENYVKALSAPKGARGPMLVIDNEIFPELPIDSIRAGSADGIPLIAGTTADEWRTWQAMDPAIKDLVEGRMYGRFRRMMPDWDMTGMVEEYQEALTRRGITVTPAEIYIAVMTARMFWIPTTQMLEAHGGRGNPAYSYMFTWKATAKNGMFGAFHGIDGGFLWGTFNPEIVGTDPAADTLSQNVQDAWIAFARTGSPDGTGLGDWQVYGERRKTMLLGQQSGIEEAPFEEERRIWDKAPSNIYKW
ncbi:MAG: carboxylesterase/lipase family protein [Dehalococcoidales bacterium]|nr:MAG: carboxylesterase/lipase family protein [Dehalococcoidales bacterium]